MDRFVISREGKNPEKTARILEVTATQLNSRRYKLGLGQLLRPIDPAIEACFERGVPLREIARTRDLSLHRVRRMHSVWEREKS